MSVFDKSEGRRTGERSWSMWWSHPNQSNRLTRRAASGNRLDFGRDPPVLWLLYRLSVRLLSPRFKRDSIEGGKWGFALAFAFAAPLLAVIEPY